jgi:glycerate kinase
VLKDKVIVIPDSFKGTMSSVRVCEVIKKALTDAIPDLEVLTIPIADGGEGTVAVFRSLFGGSVEIAKVQNSVKREVTTNYTILPDKTAVIEMSSVAGLPGMGNELNVYDASTYGVGELVVDALDKGVRKLMIGLGGSSTNDGGAGAAAAMGVRFIDKNGLEIIPVGRTLQDICSIDMSQVHPAVFQSSISLICDVDNLLLGPEGAAAVFGPQKGADEAGVLYLENGLRVFAEVIKKDLGIDVTDLRGGGAAGGMGAGFFGLFKAKIHQGIDFLLNEVRFDDQLEKTSLVITGEGRLDSQSYQGKVISGIAKRTAKKNVPLLAVVGDADNDKRKDHDYGITSVVSINRIAAPYKVLKARSEQDLYDTVYNIFNLIHILNKA